MKTNGVLIGDKHTQNDWHMILQSRTISMPTAKSNIVQIPCSDLFYDYTETQDGEVHYEPRAITLEFAVICNVAEWSPIYSEIANYLHGRQHKIIFDTDPSFYYLGRLDVDSTRSNARVGKVTITGTLDPYKYEITSSLEDWLWDPFDFRTGIIREYKDIEVNGEYTLIIPGRRKKIVPDIYCSTAMTVTYLGVTYDLKVGLNQIGDIWLGEGDHELIFRGNGTVSVDYRGASL